MAMDDPRVAATRSTCQRRTAPAENAASAGSAALVTDPELVGMRRVMRQASVMIPSCNRPPPSTYDPRDSAAQPLIGYADERMSQMRHCRAIHDAPGPRVQVKAYTPAQTAQSRVMAMPDSPPSVPIQLDRHIPAAATSMGVVRDLP